jgi:hypothetical protein
MQKNQCNKNPNYRDVMDKMRTVTEEYVFLHCFKLRKYGLDSNRDSLSSIVMAISVQSTIKVYDF